LRRLSGGGMVRAMAMGCESARAGPCGEYFMSDEAGIVRPHERFMPDWVLGLAARLALAPGLWLWGRANSGPWPSADRGAVLIAEDWVPALIPAEFAASVIVWGAQLTALILLAGFMNRLVGLMLLIAAGFYAFALQPDSALTAALFAALSFYLFARGGGALSLDGAIVATAR
jgi:putative oxidoreductase